MFIFKPQYESEQALFRLWTRANQNWRVYELFPCEWNGWASRLGRCWCYSWSAGHGRGCHASCASPSSPSSRALTLIPPSPPLPPLPPPFHSPSPPFFPPPPLFTGSASLLAKCSIAVFEPHALEDKELAQEKFTGIIYKNAPGTRKAKTSLLTVATQIRPFKNLI